MNSCGFRFWQQNCIAGLLQIEINPEYMVLVVSPKMLLCCLNKNAKVVAEVAFFKVVHNSIFIIVA